ncbi:MAG: hypothetical protein J6J11_01995 [Treponema sp.]|nr:hypothetical protein [Clostridia bacterium]MBP3607077.1 hypothetical protein [Treponema sp.]
MSNYYEDDYNESECILCGEDANGYLFCKSCYRKYKDQSILVKIDNCEDFEIIDENYEECFDFDISECVTCGDEANGHKFCNKCYHKYKNKTLTLKIINCKDVEILEEDFTSKKLITKDGHIVRSKAEREVDNYLFDNNIKHAYEKEIKLKNQYGEMIPLHPDFCIFIGDKKVYIEYWGYDESNIEYTETKKSKLNIYKNAGLTLINLYESTDAKDIESALEYKLNPKNYKEGKINFLEEK